MSLKLAASSWFVLLVSLAIGCGSGSTPTPGPGPEKGGSAKQDKEAIQGEWSGDHITVTFAGDKFVPWDRNHANAEEAAVFTLYPAKSPKQIDFKYVKDGRTQQGIYELSGDDLKLCLAEPGKERPSSFAGNVLVFKRK